VAQNILLQRHAICMANVNFLLQAACAQRLGLDSLLGCSADAFSADAFSADARSVDAALGWGMAFATRACVSFFVSFMRVVSRPRLMTCNACVHKPRIQQMSHHFACLQEQNTILAHARARLNGERAFVIFFHG
jgi:hypothetical protein